MESAVGPGAYESIRVSREITQRAAERVREVGRHRQTWKHLKKIERGFPWLDGWKKVEQARNHRGVKDGASRLIAFEQSRRGDLDAFLIRFRQVEETEQKMGICGMISGKPFQDGGVKRFRLVQKRVENCQRGLHPRTIPWMTYVRGFSTSTLSSKLSSKPPFNHHSCC